MDKVLASDFSKRKPRMRGFRSKRKTDRKDNDSGVLKQAIDQVREQIQASGCATVGEWFRKARMQQKPEGVPVQGVRARYRETPCDTDEGTKRIDKSDDLDVDRALIVQEFDALWAVQAALQPGLCSACSMSNCASCR